MDPRKITIVAAVGVAAGLAGCSAGAGARAASAARPPSSMALTPSTSSTSAPSTTTTSRTVVPTTTTRTATTATPAAGAAQAAPATTAAPCPSNLASQLAYTGSARQLVTVVAAGWHTTTATVELWQRSLGCWTAVAGPWSGYIGENGFSSHKTEGDGTTPTGIYGLGPVMYGNAPNPGVREPYHQIVCGDWWDEDPNSSGYNTFQAVGCTAGRSNPTSFGGGSEALWQETAPYPSFAVIDYNTGPIVKYAGSGIFFHAATGGPTAGCVSVPRSDLDVALRWLDPGQAPAFVMGPAGQITSF